MCAQYHCFYVNVNRVLCDLFFVAYPHMLFADNRNI